VAARAAYHRKSLSDARDIAEYIPKSYPRNGYAAWFVWGRRMRKRSLILSRAAERTRGASGLPKGGR
jgi:hypothetical protein